MNKSINSHLANRVFPALLLALALLLGGLVAPLVLAGPPEAPMGARSVGFGTTAITQTTTFAGYLWGVGYDKADLFYTTDISDAQRITITLQVSADGVTYMSHAVSPTLVSGIDADASAYVFDIPVHGVYWRTVVTLMNAGTAVTPNLRMIIK